jgi:hypothetical protein
MGTDTRACRESSARPIPVQTLILNSARTHPESIIITKEFHILENERKKQEVRTLAELTIIVQVWLDLAPGFPAGKVDLQPPQWVPE